MWRWKFALGFVLSIYIHEMGYVYSLTKHGIPTSVPLFIPGFGAVIFSRSRFISPADDARIGLAGPLWGLGATLVCWFLYLVTANPLFAALRQVSAWINLFNLIPVWSLDGSRGYRGLTRPLRWWLVAVAAATALATGSVFSWIVAGCLGGRLLFFREPQESVETDWLAFGLFAFLIVSLAWIAELPPLKITQPAP